MDADTGQKVAAMKKANKKQLHKLSVTPKKKLAKKRTFPKKAEKKTKVAENTEEALEKEVRTHDVRQDDVPGEYLG